MGGEAGVYRVLGTVPGSPAERGGVEIGDRILEVDGESVAPMSFAGVISRIRGTGPGSVRLLLLRGGEKLGLMVSREPRDAALSRQGLKDSGGRLVPTEESAVPTVGGPAPALKGLDASSGDTVDLATLKGQRVVLFFWTTWCGYCKPEIEWLRKHHGAGSSVVVAVNLDDERTSFDEFMKAGPFATRHIYDGGWFGATSKAYHVYGKGVPWSVVIGSDGKLAAEGRDVAKLMRKKLSPRTDRSPR